MILEEFNKKRILCNIAIKKACMELNLKLPEIYYVQLDDIKLYDQEGNIVSYDYRDVGYKVKSILFIPKEYVIYINVDLFQNEMNMLVKCYQTARQMYHTIQVYNQLQSKELSESTTTVNQWRYCYIERKNSKPSGITPVQADMMAFSIVMMKNIIISILNLKKMIILAGKFTERYEEPIFIIYYRFEQKTYHICR